MKPQIPTWITVVSSLIALLALFVGFSLYFSPDTFIKEVDFSTSAAQFLVGMWAARQVAIALIIGYSVLLQSAPKLEISLIAYALVNFQDLIIGIFRNDISLMIGAAIFCVIPVILVIMLIIKQKR